MVIVNRLECMFVIRVILVGYVGLCRMLLGTDELNFVLKKHRMVVYPQL